MLAAIVKPKAGPSSDLYSEEDWNTEVDENAQGADAYRYSKVRTIFPLTLFSLINNTLIWVYAHSTQLTAFCDYHPS